MTIILASTSPTRRKLLTAAGVAFQTVPPTIDEDILKAGNAGLGPTEMAVCLAEAKALSISELGEERLIIGADQILEFDNRRIDKPQSLTEARQQLLALRGKTHRLISVVACAREARIIWTHSEKADLSMRDFSDQFLDDYLHAIGSEATESVGAYKLEFRGSQLFDAIRGDYFTILGLPLISLMNFLRKIGELPA